jgi:hypothetical protein
MIKFNLSLLRFIPSSGIVLVLLLDVYAGLAALSVTPGFSQVQKLTSAAAVLTAYRLFIKAVETALRMPGTTPD